MKRILCLVAMTTLVVARPEMYKEKEDFQFSRSSSDEGRKSGYYDAQRGNMGGNYEKSHNMDKLAQHQMSGLVRQVEGELGDGAETKTGNVFTAANSQGVYGSGRYDVSNLAGRNFQEGGSIGDSRSHSSLSSHNAGYRGQSASHSSGYTNSHSLNSGYKSGYAGYDHAGTEQLLSADNLQAVDANYGNEHVGQGATYSSGYNSQGGYNSQSGYNGQSAYDARSNLHSSSAYGSNGNIKGRLISTTPVRIVVRPGSSIVVPVAAQTYDASNSASYDQNSINTNTELLTSAGHHQVKPTNHAKHYDSSYSYRKEWERHDAKPVAAPLAVPMVPIPKHSELYEDSLAHGSHFDTNLESQNQHSASFNSGYNANVKSAASTSVNSLHQSDINAQHIASSGLNSNAYMQSGYNAAGNQDSSRLVADVNSKPKSYQSSYSYHKSWERQGDPYVIQPASEALYDRQASQNLVANSHQSSYSHQHGAHHKSHVGYVQGINGQEDCECDDAGQIRVVRSANPSGYETLEDLGQQTQSQRENLEDLGQQAQTNWGQHTQGGSARLEDLGQQTEQRWNHLGNNYRNGGIEKLEDLGQQTQTHWGFQHQHDAAKLENLGHDQDLGQETQKHWGNYKPYVDNSQQNMMESPVIPWFGEEKQGALYGSDFKKHAWKVYTEQVSGEQGEQFIDHNVDETQDQHIGNYDQQFDDNTQQISLPDFWAHYHDNKQIEDQRTQYFSEHHYHSYSHDRPHDIQWDDSQTNKPIHSLWDKINPFEIESSLSNFNQQTNSDSHSNGYSNSFGTNNVDMKFLSTTPSLLRPKKPEFKNPDSQWQVITTSTTEKNEENKMNNINPIDIGRGDIGPEDLQPISTTTEAQITVNKNHYKTPEEIEALSLTKATNKSEEVDKQSRKEIINLQKQETDSHLSVLSLHEQGTITSTPVNKNVLGIHNYEKQEKSIDKEILEQAPEELYQSNLDQQPQNLEQQQQSMWGEQQLENLGQQEQSKWGEQQLEDFGQHEQSKWGEQNLKKIAQQEQSKWGEQQLEDLGQQEQSKWGEQQLENLGQQEQSKWGEQQLENLGQQEQSKWGEQQLENLGQQEQSKWGEQQLENLGQQEQSKWGEQQLEDFAQQEQSKSGEQHLDDLGQHQNKKLFPENLIIDKNNNRHHNLNKQDSTWSPANLEQLDENLEQKQENQTPDPLHKHNEQKEDSQKLTNQNDNTEQEFIIQQQFSWNKNENLEQQVDNNQEIPNFAALLGKNDQQKDDFYEQQHSVNKNVYKENEDLSQQQSEWNVNENLEQQADNGQEVKSFASFSKQQDKLLVEKPNDEGISSDVNNDSQKQAAVTIGAIPEDVSEKPGFWKSVGHKFTSAKDKVSSWFSSS